MARAAPGDNRLRRIEHLTAGTPAHFLDSAHIAGRVQQSREIGCLLRDRLRQTDSQQRDTADGYS
jgi:hypothetical protein